VEVVHAVTVLAHPVYTLGSWSGNVTDDNGVDWIIQDDDGWANTAPVRRNNQDRDADDGAWDAPAYYSGLDIVLTGTAVAPNQLLQNAAKDTLRGLFPDMSGLATLTVAEVHLTRYAFVRLGAQIKIADKGPTAFVFQLPLYAPDPRRYSALLTPGVNLPAGSGIGGRAYPRSYPLSYSGGSAVGAVQATNAGNYKTPAVLAITGPVIGPQVQHIQSGRQLRFNLTLGVSDVLTVDLASRAVLLNSTANRRPTLTADSAWFLLGPGQNDLRFSGTPGGGGTAHLTVTYRSAWI
jgi:hypothetical protein